MVQHFVRGVRMGGVSPGFGALHIIADKIRKQSQGKIAWKYSLRHMY